MTSRQRPIVLAGVLTLAAVVLVMLVAPQAEAPPASAPSPTPPASGTASPAASVIAATTAAPAGSGRYGYVVIGGGSFVLTDEEGNAIRQYACGVPGRGCGLPLVAVSPDGRRVAFWGVGQGSRWELATFEAATPGNVRGVATLPEGMEGRTLVWAADSRGLLYAAETSGYGGIRGGAGQATLTAIDVTTSAPATDVMPARTNGTFYVPVAWDRAKDIVAAVTSGEGGGVLEYVVTVGGRTTVTRMSAGEFGAWQVLASPDATRVLAVDSSANVLRLWPVTDLSAQVEIRSPGGRINGALWRTSREIGWAYGNRFDVFIPQTDTSRTVYTAPDVRLVAMRPDGTGALVASGGQINVSANLFIVDIARGTEASRTAMDVAQVVVPRGVILP